MPRPPLSRRPSAYLSGLPGYFGALARLPGVGALAPVVGLYLEALGDGGQTARGSATVAPPDGRFGRLADIPKVLAGRLPAADRAGEIAVDQHGAGMLCVQLGSALIMRTVREGPPGGGGRSRLVPACCENGWSASGLPADLFSRYRTG